VNDTIALYAGLAVFLAWSIRVAKQCLDLSRAKHPSLTGHARLARRVARQIPYFSYDETRFFNSDDAPPAVAARRCEGFMRLAQQFRERGAATLEMTNAVMDGVSDLQFTSAYRVPFPYSRYVRAYLRVGAFMQAADGVMLTDPDGNRYYDLTGSYGVNVFGHDFYKGCMARGMARVQDLGVVLGPYHPVMVYNVQRLRAISGLDEVSFHMSGTEAVMQAVRLARYHTRRTHLVRFCGAYHGWWGDVQPGVGNPLNTHETYTLKDMDADTLHVLRTRKDIACVLINPLQALHPNTAAPGDSGLLDSSRTVHYDREGYAAWLRQLREVCSARGIVLIFDEVFVGFRLALGGAQEYFGIKADMVTYGKTLGGGFPVGVVCGRHDLMKRFRDDRPVDVCFARGTFNSHPAVMGAMHEFLQALDAPETHALYRDLDTVWNARAADLNRRLQDAGVPVKVVNLSTIWTICYTQPSRYNWMLQYYLRAQGLALSWVGTGRLIFSLNYSEADFAAVAERFVAAARAMQQDGWWWHDGQLTNKAIRRRLLREMIAHRF
jgi:glutamate-1-semialdehyde 2,1-aminomutase